MLALTGRRRALVTGPESATASTASTSATRPATAACVPPPPANPLDAPSAASAGTMPPPVLTPRAPASGALPTPAPMSFQVDGGMGARDVLFPGCGADRYFCIIRRRDILGAGFGCLPRRPVRPRGTRSSMPELLDGACLRGGQSGIRLWRCAVRSFNSQLSSSGNQVAGVVQGTSARLQWLVTRNSIGVCSVALDFTGSGPETS